MKSRLAAVFSVAASLLVAPASAGLAGQVQAVDGDTIRVNGQSMRLTSAAGPIDTPEMRRAKCPLELFRAQAAKERLAQIVLEPVEIINTGERDRWERSIVLVRWRGEDVGTILLREGHAKPWPKIKGKLRRENRPTWCEG